MGAECSGITAGTTGERALFYHITEAERDELGLRGLRVVVRRRLRTMRLGRVHAATTTLHFDGRDARGERLPSGLYFCRIHAGGATVTRKMVIQR